MKTMKFLFPVLLLIFYSCSFNEKISPDYSGELTPMKGFHPNPNCVVITLEPDPSGDDTRAFIDAFQQASDAGSGSTVKLTEGKFTIGFVEIHDFEGYFTGEGKGKTIIANKEGLDCDAKWDPENLLPALISFVGGNIVISHMTFHMNDGKPCLPGGFNESFYGDLPILLGLSDYTANYVPDKRNIKGVVDNVEFIAGDDGGYGTYKTPGNVGLALYSGPNYGYLTDLTAYPLSKSDILVTRCYFENCIVGPDFWRLDESSRIKIEKNVMTGCFQQVFIGGLMGSDIIVKDNHFKNSNWYDLYIDAWHYGEGEPGLFPLNTTKYLISGNNFQSPPGVISLYIRDNFRTIDPDKVLPQLFNITGNIFTTGEGGIAIQGLITKSGKIWNNKFTGSGSMGVMIDGDEATETWSESNMLIGNNFFKADYEDAAVYLGQYSRNCKVVGVNTDLIVDEGMNNMIIGTKARKHGPHSFPKINCKLPYFHHRSIVTN